MFDFFKRKKNATAKQRAQAVVSLDRNELIAQALADERQACADEIELQIGELKEIAKNLKVQSKKMTKRIRKNA